MRLAEELPADRGHASPTVRQFAFRAKALLVELAEISLAIARLVVAEDEDGTRCLPGSWSRRRATCRGWSPPGHARTGFADVVRVRREHAFLVPPGARLPFTPSGPVFRVS